MPILVNLDSAIYKWQAVHNERLTYSELAKRAGITLASLNRMKSGHAVAPDLRKVNLLCKVLECQPGDLLIRVDTNAQQSLEEMQHEHQESLHWLRELERINKKTDSE